MSEETPLYPVDPPNPAGKPGVGGLAAIPGLIGSIVGADDFCSVWNFPLSAVCVANPSDPDRHAMPAWCLYMPDGHLCPGTVSTPDSETGLNWSAAYCFDASFNKIPCITEKISICTYFDDSIRTPAGNHIGQEGPCNEVGPSCVDSNFIPINCNLIDYDNHRSGFTFMTTTGCYKAMNYSTVPPTFKDPVPCKFRYNAQNTQGYGDGYSFDRYMRIVNTNTGIPITNQDYEGGYPIKAVYPPLVPPVEPPVVPPGSGSPFDPGPNPFDPTMPVSPVPDGEKDCSGVICECIKLVINAIGALNNTVLKVDETLLGIVDQLDDIHAKQPNWFEKLPLELLPILNKLGDILDAIDDISIDIAKEAESNIWDFLGDTIKELGDLVQFIIDKIIYLVVPEDTDFLRENFSMLREAMSTKFEPVAMLKTQIQMSLMTEQKNFKDIEMTLPIYGRVEFLNVEFLNYAVPKIRALISGIMIIVTSVWAYRKITSDMVR